MNNSQAQDHLLGAVVKSLSASNKQYIVIVLKPEAPLTTTTPVDKKSSDFPGGYFMMPKSKRGLDDEYFSSLSTRKGTGVVKISLPYHGSAAGVGYEVRAIDSKELLCICNSKIKIDQVRLLEDGSSAAFSRTVQLLLELRSDGNKYPPPLDPLKGMISSL